MPAPRPELIFVAGPQRGRRAVLLRDGMIGGRSEAADIPFVEEFISREQVLFQRLAEGWTIERLPHSNPVCVNGKEYKPGRRILLASGDVITLGARTKLLFVEADDDPNRVLAEYRRTHPEEETTEEAVVSVAKETAEVVSAAPAAAEEKKPSSARRKATAGTKSSRMRKYAAGFLVYLALLAVGAAILQQKRNEKNRRGETAPDRLSPAVIAETLRSDLVRAPNEVAAQRSRKEARNYFRLRTSERRNLYRCLTAYRLYRAYRRPEQRTFLAEDERQYRLAAEELTTVIRDLYERGWIAEQNGQWARAKEQFDRILQYIPMSLAAEDPEVRDVLLANVMDHLRYVSQKREGR